MPGPADFSQAAQAGGTPSPAAQRELKGEWRLTRENYQTFCDRITEEFDQAAKSTVSVWGSIRATRDAKETTYHVDLTSFDDLVSAEQRDLFYRLGWETGAWVGEPREEWKTARPKTFVPKYGGEWKKMHHSQKDQFSRKLRLRTDDETVAMVLALGSTEGFRSRLFEKILTDHFHEEELDNIFRAGWEADVWVGEPRPEWKAAPGSSDPTQAAQAGGTPAMGSADYQVYSGRWTLAGSALRPFLDRLRTELAGSDKYDAVLRAMEFDISGTYVNAVNESILKQALTEQERETVYRIGWLTGFWSGTPLPSWTREAQASFGPRSAANPMLWSSQPLPTDLLRAPHPFGERVAFPAMPKMMRGRVKERIAVRRHKYLESRLAEIKKQEKEMERDKEEDARNYEAWTEGRWHGEVPDAWRERLREEQTEIKRMWQDGEWTGQVPREWIDEAVEEDRQFRQGFGKSHRGRLPASDQRTYGQEKIQIESKDSDSAGIGEFKDLVDEEDVDLHSDAAATKKQSLAEVSIPEQQQRANVYVGTWCLPMDKFKAFYQRLEDPLGLDPTFFVTDDVLSCFALNPENKMYVVNDEKLRAIEDLDSDDIDTIYRIASEMGVWEKSPAGSSRPAMPAVITEA